MDADFLTWLTNGSIIIATFCFMELVAYELHRIVLNTFLWFIHDTHHLPRSGHFEKNDVIAFIFGIPSWLFMMFGIMAGCDYRLYVGIGMLVYGICYILIHDGLVHQRFKIFSNPKSTYLIGLKLGHEAHHIKDNKPDCNKDNDIVWGMLWVPHRFFRKAAELVRKKKGSIEGRCTRIVNLKTIPSLKLPYFAHLINENGVGLIDSIG